MNSHSNPETVPVTVDLPERIFNILFCQAAERQETIETEIFLRLAKTLTDIYQVKSPQKFHCPDTLLDDILMHDAIDFESIRDKRQNPEE